MSLTGEAINYIKETYPNSLGYLFNKIILRDDGNGPYIYYWGIGSPKPTEEELNEAAKSMIPKISMPSDHDLIMMLYNDKKNNTDTFVEIIDRVKNQ